LAVTQWGTLDFLVIDMPPGIGDVILDLVRLIKRIEFLIITTPSLLAFETVKKQVALLCELKMPIIGVVENMKMDVAEGVEVETGKLGLKYLGEIPFDPQVESAIGNEEKLLNTAIGKKLKRISKGIILMEKREL
jgi:ATP-binding protein involved in chromosome partitioning